MSDISEKVGAAGGLVVDEEKCVGCGKCVRSCASRGIEIVGERPNRRARVTDGCILCGICVQSCPFDALSIVRAAAGERDEAAAGAPKLSDYRDVWVFAQTDGGAVAPVVFELLGKGRELADARGCELVAVLGEGEDVPREASACAGGAGDVAGTAPAGATGVAGTTPAGDVNTARLVAGGADRVIRCRDKRLASHDTEAYAAWICSLVTERLPEILLFGATDFGRELAPSVAARIRTGLTADCTVLRIDPETGLLQQTRPAFGGNLMATIVCPDHRPQMATVRAGVLTAPEPDPGRTGTVVDVEAPVGTRSCVRVLETVSADDGDSIADADRLVVVGRGIGAKKNLALVSRLAELLGAKLGCSRPLVESGWLEYKHQVGQTGCSVAPKLLVSVGVSGAIQHLAGIGGAECVVAINTDPSAPIFGVSQYTVCGDCVEILKEWIAQLEAGQAE